jgi:ubiquitin-like-conjugating enzyme ATG10
MFFIHPCNTADALGRIVGERKIDSVEYLLIWLGLVGSCVDLCVPSELAERLMRKT